MPKTVFEPPASVNPASLFDQIEHESTGLPPADSYRAQIEMLMAAALEKEGNPDHVADASHIRATTAGLVLEIAARRAGFVVRFEHCRELMLSSIVQVVGPLKTSSQG